VCCMEERVAKSMEVTSRCILCLVMCDIRISLEDEIARRFMNFISGCMLRDSTLISSVVSHVCMPLASTPAFLGVPSLRAADGGDLQVTRKRMKIGDRSFHIAATNCPIICTIKLSTNDSFDQG